MIADFSVTYADGTTEAGRTSLLSSIETERRFSTSLFEPSTVTARAWWMWRSLNPQADVEDEAIFAEWVAKVADFDFDVGDGDGRAN